MYLHMHMSAHHFSPKQNKTYLSAKKKKKNREEKRYCRTPLFLQRSILKETTVNKPRIQNASQLFMKKKKKENCQKSSSMRPKFKQHHKYLHAM